MGKIVLLSTEPLEKICHIYIVAKLLGEYAWLKVEECAIEKKKKQSLFEEDVP